MGLVFDVKDFGAVPDGRDCREAFQRAIDAAGDAALAAGRDTGATVVVPSDPRPYSLFGSVFVDRDWVRLVGDPAVRRGSKLVFWGRHSGVVLGHMRRPVPTLDVDGVYDSSVSTPRKPIRLGRRGFLQFQYGGAALGQALPDLGSYRSDNWRSTSAFTVDVMVGTGDGKPIPEGVPLLGFGHIETGGRPWLLRWGPPGTLILDYRTWDDEPWPDGPTSAVWWDLGTDLPPILRLTVQVDLSLSTFEAKLAGRGSARVAVNHRPPEVGSRFAECHQHPFMIGASGVSAMPGGNLPTDYVVYGCKVSAGRLYTGALKDRRDGKTANDMRRYFEPDESTIALLTMRESPLATLGLVECQHGHASGSEGLGSGWYLETTEQRAINQPGVENLVITSDHGGATVAIGNALDPTVKDCLLVGGHTGIGSINGGANYQLRVDGCEVRARDAVWAGCQQYAVFRDLLGTGSRVTFRAHASMLTAENVRLGNEPDDCLCFVHSTAGNYEAGVQLIGPILIDYESRGYSDRQGAFIHMETSQYVNATLDISGPVRLGNIGTGVPIYRLITPIEPTPAHQPGMLRVGPVRSSAVPDDAHQYTLAYVDPMWGGTIDASLIPLGQRIVTYALKADPADLLVIGGERPSPKADTPPPPPPPNPPAKSIKRCVVIEGDFNLVERSL